MESKQASQRQKAIEFVFYGSGFNSHPKELTPPPQQSCVWSLKIRDFPSSDDTKVFWLMTFSYAYLIRCIKSNYCEGKSVIAALLNP